LTEAQLKAQAPSLTGHNRRSVSSDKFGLSDFDVPRIQRCSARPPGRIRPNIQTAWETLKLLAYGFEPRRGGEGAAWAFKRSIFPGSTLDRGACRLLAGRASMSVTIQRWSDTPA
jgi:hypothetical protein